MKPSVVQVIHEGLFTFVKVAQEVEVGIESKSRKVKLPTVKVMVEGTGMAKQNTDMGDKPDPEYGEKRAKLRAYKDFNRKRKQIIDQFASTSYVVAKVG